MNSPGRHQVDLPLSFHPAATRASAFFEVLPETRPGSAGIFRVKAHVGGGADEPFNSDIGALLPIALCGRTSL
jgi:hypothetical protein